MRRYPRTSGAPCPLHKAAEFQAFRYFSACNRGPCNRKAKRIGEILDGPVKHVRHLIFPAGHQADRGYQQYLGRACGLYRGSIDHVGAIVAVNTP